MNPSYVGILLFVVAVMVHRTLAQRAWERLDDATRVRLGAAQSTPGGGLRSLLVFLALVLLYTALKTRWPAAPWPSLGFIAVLLALFVSFSVAQLRRLAAAEPPAAYLRTMLLGKALLTLALLVLFGLVLARGGL